MITNESTVDVLNDLVQINNDRIEGYEKALKELPATDTELRMLFTTMISESHHYKLALVEELQVLGGTSERSTTTSGKIYRAWMDVKAVFTGRDRKSILENCETGEEAAQKAYRTALEPGTELPMFIKDLVLTQQQSLKASQDKITFLHDQTF